MGQKDIYIPIGTDKYAKQRAELHRKLLSGELTIEEYDKINPRIRMASDNGLEDIIDTSTS